MKKVLFFLIIVILVCSNSSFAKEGPESILKNMPKEVGEFESGRLIVYGDEHLGAALGYRDKYLTDITFFIYDLGHDDIKEGPDSSIVENAKKMAIEDIKTFESRGNYINVRVLLDADRVFELENGKNIETKWTVFSYDKINPNVKEIIPVISEVYITGLKGHICKIRVTRLSDLDVDKVTELQKVLEVMLVSITS